MALTDATPVLELDQLAIVVIFVIVLSVQVPLAVNCCVLPAVIEGLGGIAVTVIDTSAFSVLKDVSAP